jgi:UDP-N-acetylglucosamine--N-acetylmuramyl-(pentapeptide) pyrophosphoryl-undecaprenol N-acetylglucosamine transferase
MSEGKAFLMAAGGTGGHVMPALAVARELRRRGHEPFFIGSRNGLEAKLVPAEGFPLEYIEVGALARVGWRQSLRSLSQLPAAVWRSLGILRRRQAGAAFSLGGYVAGPPTLAAWLRGIPIVLMEPNAVPGLTNRWMGRFAERALIHFESAAAGFPRGKCELTGVPVREEFFAIRPKRPGERFTLLITGGSRGSRRLNQASRQAWPLFRAAEFRLRLVHQCGEQDYPELRREFEASGVEGEVTPFIRDMPAAFAEADLVVCRSGAGAVAELAAAGKPSILVPFPYAAGQHQLRNAEQMAAAGAARLVRDEEMDGARLFEETRALAGAPEQLRRMGEAARALARPGAAARAADVLEQLAAGGRPD